MVGSQIVQFNSVGIKPVYGRRHFFHMQPFLHCWCFLSIQWCCLSIVGFFPPVLAFPFTSPSIVESTRLLPPFFNGHIYTISFSLLPLAPLVSQVFLLVFSPIHFILFLSNLLLVPSSKAIAQTLLSLVLQFFIKSRFHSHTTQYSTQVPLLIPPHPLPRDISKVEFSVYLTSSRAFIAVISCSLSYSRANWLALREVDLLWNYLWTKLLKSSGGWKLEYGSEKILKSTG